MPKILKVVTTYYNCLDDWTIIGKFQCFSYIDLYNNNSIL